MANNGDISLATLPADIIRKIIRIEDPIFIDRLILISKQWTSLVLERANKRKQLPEIEHILIKFDLNFCPELDRIYIEKRSHRIFAYYRYDIFSDINPDGELFSQKNQRQRLMKIIRCRSSIQLLELEVIKIQPGTLDSLCNFLGTIPISTLRVCGLLYFDIHARSSFCDLIRSNGIKYLEMEITLSPVAELREFIVESVQYLRSIRIKYTMSSFIRGREFWESFNRNLNSGGHFDARFSTDGKIAHIYVVSVDNIMNDEITLATLPPDIIRQIIRMEDPVFIDKLLLISQEWKSLVLERFNKRKLLPEIDIMFCGFTGKFNPELVWVQIDRCYQLHPLDRYDFNDIECSRTHMHKNLKNHLRSRSNLKLLQVTLTKTCPNTLECLCKLLGSIPITTFHIFGLMYFDKSARSAIFDLIRSNAIKHLDFEFNSANFEELRKFIADSMKFLQSIKIYHKSTGYTQAAEYMTAICKEIVQKLTTDTGIEASLCISYKHEFPIYQIDANKIA